MSRKKSITIPDGLPLIEVEALVPYANNARTHSPEQVDQIAASLQEFGFTNPLLIDEDGGIIAGHGRLLAARELGLTRVPFVRLSHLSPDQRRAYVLADNRLALNAGWDEDLLSLELGDLDSAGFDILLIGFSDEELAGLLLDEAPEEPGSGAAEPQETVPEPVSVAGAVWLLGLSRFDCGPGTDRAGLLACDDAVRSWQEFTGSDARLEKTGDTFAELAAMRGQS